MNIGKKALEVLKAVAPTVATAIGGPFGGMAAAALEKVLGTQPDAKLASASPELLAALKGVENAFLVKMEELEISREKLVFDDIADARAREIAVKDHTPAVLAYLVTAGFFGVLGYLLVMGKPVAGGDALLIMLGSLGTAWTGIVAYYFGSSVGSKSKTDLLTTKK
jgi:hypothetical protein